MPLVADRVKETTTTTGTGALTLAGATTGYQSFTAAFGNGVSVYYVIAGGADWEVGIGTTGAGTLSRDSVLASSNANALVPLAAGAKDVFCAYVAGRAVTTEDAATLTNKTIDDYTNNVGANSTHFRIKAGATLAKGDVVKAVGFTPGEQAIEVVKVASSADVALGICEQALNTGNFGTAVVIGELFSVNTNGFTVGDTLYNNGAGGYTATKPSSGLYQVLGWVVRVNASNGVIAVNVVSPLYVETSSNTVNTAVLRDGSGNFSAGTITAALTGNASTATALSSVRTFELTGDVTGTVSSNLSTGASINTTIAAGAIVNADINAAAAIADTKLATISTAGKVANSATTATNANTASAIVARDASGNFTAGTITASLSGNATTATTATQVSNALTAGTYLTSGGTFTGAAARTFAVDATEASTASKVVARNASGQAAVKGLLVDGTSSGTVTVQGAAAAGTWSLTLPTSGGTNGHFLQTNGSGVTSWAAAGGATVNQQVFNSSGTWNKPASGSMILIEVWGGGGGGSNDSTGQTQGTGGSGGNYVWRVIRMADAGSTGSVTVGAGGTGAASGVTGNGNYGGNSSFTTTSGTTITVTAAGGVGAGNNYNTLPQGNVGSSPAIVTFKIDNSVQSTTYLAIANLAVADGYYFGGIGITGTANCYQCSSVYGGGGGGSQLNTGAGTSMFAGAGGTRGINGTAPAGGGGSGNGASGAAGSGGAGRVVVTVW